MSVFGFWYHGSNYLM